MWISHFNRFSLQRELFLNFPQHTNIKIKFITKYIVYVTLVVLLNRMAKINGKIVFVMYMQNVKIFEPAACLNIGFLPMNLVIFQHGDGYMWSVFHSVFSLIDFHNICATKIIFLYFLTTFLLHITYMFYWIYKIE